MNLITMDEAKRHLNLDHNADDLLIEEMRLAASDIIIDYLKMDVNDSTFDWVDNNGEPSKYVPYKVKAAVKLTLGALYENRDGDNWRAPQPISDAVVSLLYRTRDPAMA